jgi:hypothetical protein
VCSDPQAKDPQSVPLRHPSATEVYTVLLCALGQSRSSASRGLNHWKLQTGNCLQIVPQLMAHRAILIKPSSWATLPPPPPEMPLAPSASTPAAGTPCPPCAWIRYESVR